MTMSDPRIIDPTVVAEVSAMLAANQDPNRVVAHMRAGGLNKVECIKLFHQHGGVTLGKAKDIVHLSPAWADRYQADEAFHDAAEQAMAVVLAREEQQPAA